MDDPEGDDLLQNADISRYATVVQGLVRQAILSEYLYLCHLALEE